MVVSSMLIEMGWIAEANLLYQSSPQGCTDSILEGGEGHLYPSDLDEMTSSLFSSTLDHSSIRSAPTTDHVKDQYLWENYQVDARTR